MQKRRGGSFLNPDKHIEHFLATYDKKTKTEKIGTEGGLEVFQEEKMKTLKELKKELQENQTQALPTVREETSKLLKEAVLEKLSTMFLPEFLNRLDDIIIFQPLQPNELRKICDIMVNQVINRVKEKGIDLTVDNRVKVKLTREGYNPMFGARPLRRLVTKYIEDIVSETLLTHSKGPKGENLKLRILLDDDDKIITNKILEERNQKKVNLVGINLIKKA
jgi:ATP-dependent Clp protease ATP-binding subunit ClpA